MENSLPPVVRYNLNYGIIVPMGTIKGTLDELKCPIIAAVVYGLEFPALIDTGAHHCCIREDLFEKFNLQSYGKTKVSKPTGDEYRDVTMLMFKLKGVEGDFVVQANVIDSSFNYPLIIGTKFLSTECRSFTYDSKGECFELVI